MPTKIEKDSVTGTDTTGHEWDGVKELNTPLPKWWLYTFYATIAWGLIYTVFYPAWPSLSSHTPGVAGYSQRVEIAREMAAEAAKREPILRRIREAPLDQILAAPDLRQFSIAGGRVLFAENCAGCHGAGGAGATGFPSLADDDWMWGGALAQIEQSIRYGVRNADQRSRLSQMPRFGLDGVLKPDEIADVAEHVLSLGGTSSDTGAARRGQALYGEHCVACHGQRGEGNQEVGGPRLNDRIWLYGGDKASIMNSIRIGPASSMPAWVDRLDAATIKMLSVYVHALGGGR